LFDAFCLEELRPDNLTSCSLPCPGAELESGHTDVENETDEIKFKIVTHNEKSDRSI
jgi:hypothetical protein